MPGGRHSLRLINNSIVVMFCDATRLAPDWATPPARPALGPCDLHVWRARLDVRAATLERLRLWLSPDERNRADRFHRDVDRRRFVAARGILREILGRYAGLSPGALTFRYGGRGKPELVQPTAGGLPAFNLSHSAGRALCAIASTPDVGVDLERVRRFEGLKRFAQRRFSADEVRALAAASEDRRPEIFFEHWVRREAAAKATGEGLHAIDAGPAADAAILSFEPFRGFVAAVSVPGAPAGVRCWTWNDGRR